ncbi:LPS assembly protein LptD, partial [Neptuniibacter sp.]|uniref:LPS-assembly protein LptD n=1 Tax=Neptuniibacter sp. TaxID=1962643 RepID=UPI0026162DF9
MSQNGEWDCDINEEAIKKAEAEQSITDSAQTVDRQTDSESVVVEPAPNAAAAPLPSVKVETKNPNRTPSTQQRATPSHQEPDRNIPLQTAEVIGNEWQCGTTPSGDWDCNKVSVHATVLPGHQATPGVKAAPEQKYITENPYAHLDWVFYKNPEGLQCEGRYLEPQFPVMGDEDQTNPPLHLEADQSSTVIGGLAQLQGGVTIRQGARRLRASSADLDQVTNKARLEGNVTFREPGLLMLSDSAQVDTTTSEAIFTNAQYILHEDRLRGTADRIIRLQDERLRIENGNYSYCPPYSNAWGLTADSIVLDQEEGFGTAEDAVLRVAGVPVLYTPYFTFPIDDARRSGFLYPSFGYNKETGLDLSVPYYFNIAPNMDDTLTTRYLSDRGLILENEFRYLNHWSENVLNTAYMPDDDKTGDDRWLLGIGHKGQLSKHWQSEVEFTSVSDTEYFDDLDTDLEVKRQHHLDQRADLSYSTGNWRLRARVHDYQTINTDSTAPYKKLPQLTLTGNKALSEQSNFSLRAEYTQFDRDLYGLSGADRIIGDRAFLLPSLSYEWRTPGYFIKPELSLWSSSYSLDNQLSGRDENPSITAPMLSIDSGLIFERNMGNGGIHTLEPRLFALYVSEEEQDDIPDFDTSELDFNYNYLFRRNRFSGYDRIGDTQQISLGLSSAFYTAQGAEKARVSIGQAYYFADRKVTLASNAPDETSKQSDIAAEAIWHLTPNFRASLDAILDKSDFKNQESNLR